ncbi:DUF6221 family protein [Streptomyces rubiginosohelvolus]|uniref:DUF6221 family protein n=1 Tax=Streptomyces rubiginosohelvolus TaxID=67362 RepID=UPI0033FF2930
MTAQGEEILAYLDAAITAWENTARAAAEAVGGERWTGSDREVVVDLPGGDTIADGVTYGDMHESMKQQASDHIALNDPESILRRCAADRKLIAEHGPWSATATFCKGCGLDSNEELITGYYEDCPVLCALAEGYGWTEGER